MLAWFIKTHKVTSPYPNYLIGIFDLYTWDFNQPLIDLQ